MSEPALRPQNQPLTEARGLAMLRRVCAARDWRLLAYPELGLTEAAAARQVVEVAAGWPLADAPAGAGAAEFATDAQLERAVVRVYCRAALYPAIHLDRAAAQERAFIELWRYVYPIALRFLRDPMQAAAVANGALATAWRERGRVKDPGALLYWAAKITTHAAYAALRDAGRDILSLDAEDEEGDRRFEEEIAGRMADRQPLLAADTLRRGEVGRASEQEDEQATLERLIRRCLRSASQQEVFIALVLRRATVLEVAAGLGITANHVAVLKARAKNGLRRCGALLAELGRALAGPAGVGADAR